MLASGVFVACGASAVVLSIVDEGLSVVDDDARKVVDVVWGGRGGKKCQAKQEYECKMALAAKRLESLHKVPWNEVRLKPDQR
jgi:serine acetyltransferase